MIEVIILGAARSGTRFLRDLLATADRTAVVPHDIGYVWRHGNEAVGHDELEPSDLSSEQAAWIRDQVRRQARADGTGGVTHLIEKSVPNSLRPTYVSAIFPQAHLVHLVRDGRQVVESAHRAWHTSRDSRDAFRKLLSVPLRLLPLVVAETVGVGPAWARQASRTWGPRYNGIDRDRAKLSPIEVCATQWARCVTRSLDGLKACDQPVHTVDFEQLVTDSGAVTSLATDLGLDPDQAAQTVVRWRQTADQSRLASWRGRLTTDEQRQIAPIINPVNARLGHGSL